MQLLWLRTCFFRDKLYQSYQIIETFPARLCRLNAIYLPLDSGKADQEGEGDKYADDLQDHEWQEQCWQEDLVLNSGGGEKEWGKNQAVY